MAWGSLFVGFLVEKQNYKSNYPTLFYLHRFVVLKNRETCAKFWLGFMLSECGRLHESVYVTA